MYTGSEQQRTKAAARIDLGPLLHNFFVPVIHSRFLSDKAWDWSTVPGLRFPLTHTGEPSEHLSHLVTQTPITNRNVLRKFFPSSVFVAILGPLRRIERISRLILRLFVSVCGGLCSATNRLLLCRPKRDGSATAVAHSNHVT